MEAGRSTLVAPRSLQVTSNVIPLGNIKMRTSIKMPLLAIVVAGFLTPAFGKDHGCHVDRFQGATLPQGAVTHMTVVNGGESCGISNYGGPDRDNPADSGSITTAPTHGTAEFVAPRAAYTPQPGFVGDDEFAYQAYSKGQHFKVKVEVKVVAP